MDESVFFKSFELRASETDANRQIKVPDLISCMQEAAWDNATNLGFSTYDMLENNITWVINRMYLEITKFPAYPQTIKVETWPSGLDKYFAYRDFRIFSESEELLAQATSNWLVLDIVERKLIAVPDFVREAKFTVDRNPMPKIKNKYAYDQEKTENEIQIPVSWFDLDVNEHVNNTKYFQWSLDALEPSILSEKTLKKFDITFKSEASIGNILTTSSYREDQHSFAHQISNESGKILVLARSRFE